MNIAFFDFDGTITQKDSLFVFIKFLLGKRVFYLGLAKNFHYLLAYILGLLSNSKAKEKLVKTFLERMSWRELEERSLEFLPLLEKMMKTSAKKRIKWHQSRGDEVVIVSATFSCYLNPLARKLGVDCLATELEIKRGLITGKFATPNCYGKEKARRIKAKYDLQDYQEIYAYGDSKGDREMLELARYRFFKYF